MRILIVTDHYPPFIGGAHRQSYVLGQKLHQAGHTLAVATVWHPNVPSTQDDNGVQVYRLKQSFSWLPSRKNAPPQRHHPPFPDLYTAYHLKKIIRKFKPEVIHVHGWISYSLALALRGMRTPPPMLVSGRDYGYRCATRSLLYDDKLCSGPELKKCIGCANRFYGTPKGLIAVLGVFSGLPLLRGSIGGLHSISKFVRDFDEKAMMGRRNPATDTRPSVIIPSFLVGLDDTVGLSDQYTDQIPTEPFMLFVGAIMRRKGVYQLLEAYQQLKPKPPLLVLIGTLEADAPTEFPPGVVILQNFPHSCVMVAWQRCLFGVVPSLWPEPLGAVVFEAMSRSKAVIGTKPGGHEEMIADGKTGFLVPLGDVEALRNAMQTLIDNSQMREEFGSAGKASLSRFTADAALPQFEALYRRVIEAAAPTAQPEAVLND